MENTVRTNALTTIFFGVLLHLQGVLAQGSTASLGGTSTLIPIVDVYATVVENAVTALAGVPLLVLSAWIIGVIFVARALPKSNFVYHVLNLAIADVVVALGDIVGGIEATLAPNSWGGLSSATFSPQWGTFGLVLSDVGATQHYVVMAVIAVDRLYAILRPIAYKNRGPPIVITAFVNVFFAANLVATACCFTIDGEFSFSEAFDIAIAFNDYLSATLVFGTVLTYVALAIVFSQSKMKVSPENAAIKQHFDRQKQITQTVARVAVMYVATAFTSTIAFLVVIQLSNYDLISMGTFLAASNFWFGLMAAGQCADLTILAVKIEPIAEPSAKYLKMLRVRCCGVSGQEAQPQRFAAAFATRTARDIPLAQVTG